MLFSSTSAGNCKTWLSMTVYIFFVHFSLIDVFFSFQFVSSIYQNSYESYLEGHEESQSKRAEETHWKGQYKKQWNFPCYPCLENHG